MLTDGGLALGVSYLASAYIEKGLETADIVECCVTVDLLVELRGIVLPCFGSFLVSRRGFSWWSSCLSLCSSFPVVLF